MQTLQDQSKLSLQILKAYIEYIKDLYKENPAEASNLLLVLDIYKCHLMLLPKRKAASGETLQMFKHGVRMAGNLIEEIIENEPLRAQGWYWGCTPTNQVQRLANILCEIIMELTKIIAANEALYPHLKDAFDRERAEWYAMAEAAREASL